jgi:RNA polymerase sigma factor (sigma-70 family)
MILIDLWGTHGNMTDYRDDSIKTSASLLGRLKNSKDQSSWQMFFDTYAKLIVGVARKAGLSEAEAEEVLKDTMALVAEQMPTFQYDPKLGSFKAWLLKLTRLRIITFARKRRSPFGEKSKETPDALADPSGQAIDRMWEAEWEINLLNAAITNVRRRLNPQNYQIYDLYVNKQWTPQKVANAFGVSVDQVYSAKNSITEMIKEEAKRLEQQML